MGRTMKLKPFYSIQELADILGEEVHKVADGLFAYGIPAIFCGKQIVLSDYGCFWPPKKGSVQSIFVFTGERPASPEPYNVCVATEKLPPLWIDSIEKAEPAFNGEQTPEQMVLPTSERNNLLKQIGSLSLLISEKSNLYKKGNKPNALQIATAVGEIVDALPAANKAALGASSIRESIRKGIELLTAIQQ